MGIVNQVLQLLFSLSLLIVLHELGHFIPAKLFKTRVEKFYLFFPAWFSLYKKKIGETTYGIGWLPLGGFVKIAGMVDESMDKEAMKEEPKPWEFRSKPAWQRLIIMLGGVFVNVVVAIVIYIMVMFVYGQTVIPNKSVVDGIVVHQKGFSDAVNLKTGDKIIEINGESCEDKRFFKDVLKGIQTADSVKLLREGEELTVKLPVQLISIMKKYKDKGLIDIRRPFVVGTVDSTLNAKKAGILKGDVINSVNGQTFTYYDEFKTLITSNKGQQIELVITRDSSVIELEALVDTSGLLGFTPLLLGTKELMAKNVYAIQHIEYDFFEAIPAGFTETKEQLEGYIQGFMKILDFKTKAYEAVGGFKAFGGMFSTSWNWELIWRNTAFISIMLAFMNLLPIPALDGGHAMFLSYELITGRKPHEKIMEYLQVAGMILLLGLVLVVNVKDWI